MDKFTKGVIAASIVGGAAVSASLLMNDPYTRKRLAKNTKILSRKAGNFMDM